MCSTVHRCVCTFVSVCIFGLSSKYLPICLYVSMYVDTIIMCCVMHAFRWSVSLYLSAYRFNFSCAVSVSLSVPVDWIDTRIMSRDELYTAVMNPQWTSLSASNSIVVWLHSCPRLFCQCRLQPVHTWLFQKALIRNVIFISWIRLPLRAPNKTAVIRISNIILVHSMDVHV